MHRSDGEPILWACILDIDAVDQAATVLAALYEALTALTEEVCDYGRINNLGDPELKHNIKLARVALAQAEGRQP